MLGITYTATWHTLLWPLFVPALTPFVVGIYAGWIRLNTHGDFYVRNVKAMKVLIGISFLAMAALEVGLPFTGV